MALPIDVKEVMNVAGDIDEARLLPVSVAVLVDMSAPEDCRSVVIEAFTTDAANANVAFGVYEDNQVGIPDSCDLVVLVAGFSEATGPLAARIRQSGKPVVVVTTMPEIVAELAQATGSPLLDGDLVTVEVAIDSDALAQDNDFYKEPYPLDEERKHQLLTRLGAWFVDTFKEKRLALALCFPFVRRPLSLEYVNATSVQNAGVGAIVLIPGADMPVMTANQAKMILQIAAAYGQKMGTERLKELLGVVGGAFAFRTLARQLVGSIPVGGWVIKGGIGYMGTQAMGRAAVAYFEQLIGQGKPAQEAVEAARAEAARMVELFKSGSNPGMGAALVARNCLGRVGDGVSTALNNAIPAVKQAIPVAKDAVGSVVQIAEDAGIDPAEYAKQALTRVITGKNKTK